MAAGTIYGLFDPRTRELRYVGKTERVLNVRLNHHIHRALHQNTNTHKATWIRSVLRDGLRPEIDIIEKVEGDLNEAERFWIAYFRSIGCRLVNHTNGGEGASGYRHTDEARRRMSSKKLGQPNHRKGFVQPLDAKLAVSRTKTGLTKEQQTEIAQAYATGESPSSIAARFGVERNTPPRLAKLMLGIRRGYGPLPREERLPAHG